MASYVASSTTWSDCNSDFAPVDGDEITIANDSFLLMDENSVVGETFSVIIGDGSDLDLDGYTLAASVDGGVATQVLVTDGLLTGGITASGSMGVLLGTTGAIDGYVNADGNDIIWTGIGTLDCSTVATLDLGGSALGLSIEVSASTTIATDITCLGFDHSAGTITCTGLPTISVGTGGFQAGSTITSVGYRVVFTANTTFAKSLVTAERITVESGVTINTSSSVNARNLTGSGTVNLGVNGWFMKSNADGWGAGWSGKFTSTSGFLYFYNNGYDPQCVLEATNLWFRTTADKSVTLTKALKVSGKLIIASSAAGFKSTVITPAAVKVGTLILGNASGTGSGIFNTTGSVLVGGIKKGHADNSQNALTLNESYIECSGTFDGDGITITDTKDTVHINGRGTGTIQNVATNNQIHAHDFATYGSGATANTNVDEDEWATVNSSSLMGVGV